LSSNESTDRCRHTITLISTSGGVYHLFCEQKGPHDKHLMAVDRRDPDAIETTLAAQREGLLDHGAEAWPCAWRMDPRTWRAVQDIAPDSVDHHSTAFRGLPAFHGLPIVIDNAISGAELIWTTPQP
jgi:hypothetical protein